MSLRNPTVIGCLLAACLIPNTSSSQNSRPDPPFLEHDSKGVPYEMIHKGYRVWVYAERPFLKKAERLSDKIVEIYLDARKCYPEFIEKRLAFKPEMSDENLIHVMFTRSKWLNWKTKIIPSDYKGRRKIEAVTRCTQQTADALTHRRRTSVFVDGRVANDMTFKHEFFHLLVCRTLNWGVFSSPNYNTEEKLAIEFESFRCK